MSASEVVADTTEGKEECKKAMKSLEDKERVDMEYKIENTMFEGKIAQGGMAGDFQY